MDNRKVAKQLVKIAKSLSADKFVKVRVDGEKLVKALVGKVREYDENGIYYEHEDGLASINGLDVVEQMIENIHREIKDYRIQGHNVIVTFDVPKIQEFMEGSGSRSMDYSEEDAIDDIENNPIGMIASLVSQFGSRVDPYDYIVEIEQPDHHIVTFNDEIIYDGDDKDDANKAYDEAWNDCYNEDELVWTINNEEFASA